MFHGHTLHGEDCGIPRDHPLLSSKGGSVHQRREDVLVANGFMVEGIVGQVGNGLGGILAVLVRGLFVLVVLGSQAQLGQCFEQTWMVRHTRSILLRAGLDAEHGRDNAIGDRALRCRDERIEEGGPAGHLDGDAVRELGQCQRGTLLHVLVLVRDRSLCECLEETRVVGHLFGRFVACQIGQCSGGSTSCLVVRVGAGALLERFDDHAAAVGNQLHSILLHECQILQSGHGILSCFHLVLHHGQLDQRRQHLVHPCHGHLIRGTTRQIHEHRRRILPYILHLVQRGHLHGRLHQTVPFEDGHFIPLRVGKIRKKSHSEYAVLHAEWQGGHAFQRRQHPGVADERDAQFRYPRHVQQNPGNVGDGSLRINHLAALLAPLEQPKQQRHQRRAHVLIRNDHRLPLRPIHHFESRTNIPNLILIITHTQHQTQHIRRPQVQFGIVLHFIRVIKLHTRPFDGGPTFFGSDGLVELVHHASHGGETGILGVFLSFSLGDALLLDAVIFHGPCAASDGGGEAGSRAGGG
mmetsp:Transcript_34683/g.62455  ORF Transcript_34683/g.62455 Transcript_34683/m.62455 type:complete len:523 (+) Transcript_34683:337-1905(+)